MIIMIKIRSNYIVTSHLALTNHQILCLSSSKTEATYCSEEKAIDDTVVNESEATANVKQSLQPKSSLFFSKTVKCYCAQITVSASAQLIE